MAESLGDREKITSRLNGTVCLYKNEPVLVETRNHKDKKTVSILSLEGEPSEVDYTSDDFSYTFGVIGYVNHLGTASYLTRIPVRRWKQGLSETNVNVLNSKGFSARTLLKSKGFSDMIKNKYPSLKKAAEELSSGRCESIAVSHNFAFITEGIDFYSLEYRGRKIGEASILNEETGEFKIRLSLKMNFSTTSFKIRRELGFNVQIV
jgi:hypothetical protein